MKIILDLSYCNPKKPTGVSIYGMRLLEAVVKANIPVCLFVSHQNRSYFCEVYPQIESQLVGSECISNILFNFLKRFYLKKERKRACAKLRADIIIIPFLTLWSIVPSKIISVVVVHDVQPFLLVKGIKRYLYRFLLKQRLYSAHKIVTISEYSKKEILELFPSIGNKIAVIYNSVIMDEPSVTEKVMINHPYILDVNNLAEYKNHLTIIKAFECIAPHIPHFLVIKARKNNYWYSVLYPYIQTHNLQSRVIILDENLSGPEMSALYSRADLFVSSSSMEGFGYTPIEAAICQTPVISSKCGALWETTAGKLNYYEPETDYIRLSERILSILNSPPLESDLSSLSDYFKERYSEERQFQSILDVLNSQLICWDSAIS